MKKQGRLLILCLIVGGFLIVSWLWPNHEGFPVLDRVTAFQLDDVHGDIYQLDNDKVKLITFFFTHCPDICPMTMMDFRDLQSQLKEEGLFGNEVELIAISLDPENDLPETIEEYANAFQADPHGWKWLRGTPEETRKIANELQMQYQIEDGVVTYHSITMYLIDENNYIRALYDMAVSDKPVNKSKILEDMVLLVDTN